MKVEIEYHETLPGKSRFYYAKMSEDVAMKLIKDVIGKYSDLRILRKLDDIVLFVYDERIPLVLKKERSDWVLYEGIGGDTPNNLKRILEDVLKRAYGEEYDYNSSWKTERAL